MGSTIWYVCWTAVPVSDNNIRAGSIAWVYFVTAGRSSSKS